MTTKYNCHQAPKKSIAVFEIGLYCSSRSWPTCVCTHTYVTTFLCVHTRRHACLSLSLFLLIPTLVLLLSYIFPINLWLGWGKSYENPIFPWGNHDTSSLLRLHQTDSERKRKKETTFILDLNTQALPSLFPFLGLPNPRILSHDHISNKSQIMGSTW